MMKFKLAKRVKFQVSSKKCQSSENGQLEQQVAVANKDSKSADIDIVGEEHQMTTTDLCAVDLESQSNRQQRRNYFDSIDNNASEARDACIDGVAGLFVSIKTDFTITRSPPPGSHNKENIKSKGKHFEEKPQWSQTKRRKIQKVRFVICFLGLLGLSLSQMSRMILNVGIADMTRKPVTVLVNANASEHNATIQLKPSEIVRDRQKSANNDYNTLRTFTDNDSTTTIASVVDDDQKEVDLSTVTTLDDTTTSALPLVGEENSTSAPTVGDNDNNDDYDNDSATLVALTTHSPPTAPAQSEAVEADAPIQFDWSNSQKNLLISSFYMGYAPCMLFGGSLADKYGAKYILFVSVFGSSIINMLTPSIASYRFSLLIASRVTLGLLQGGLVPACYELFNKWLTSTEASIFAPMIKVSLALGSFSGSLLPGIVAFLGYQWTCLFYITSLLCGLWSLFWYPLATSIPQTNQFVGPKELHRIVRKKQPINFGPACVSVIGNGNGVFSRDPQEKSHKLENFREPEARKAKAKAKADSTPWILILTNPSVLALALVKITYNIGMDFFGLELAIYLQQVHNAPTEVISAVASGGCIIQMALITFVAWLAGDVVRKAKFGISRTKWRKIFQGISNFSMASIYFVLPAAGDNLTIITVLVVLVFFFWIFAAGGESMVPYDMSTRYPATIVGFTHSVSILSGLGVPLICSLVLGDDSTNPTKWNYLFLIVGTGLAVGGIVFTLVLKAKPFLPGEIVPKLSAQQMNGRQDVKLVVDSNSISKSQQRILHDHQHRH